MARPGTLSLLGLCVALTWACRHAQPGGDEPAPSSKTRAGVTSGWHHEVTLDAALTRLDVHLCFQGDAPARLTADFTEALEFLAEARDSSGEPLTIDREARTIELTGLGSDACLDYQVDVAALVEDGPARQVGRAGDAVLLAIGLWLWRPVVIPDDVDGTLEFKLAAGHRASTPWPEVAGKPGVYAVPMTTYRWRSQVVIGDLEVQQIDAAGARFSAVVLDRPRALTDAGLARWISAAAETVALLYGSFPVTEAQIIVIPTGGGGGGDPVRFGLASRGGGPCATFLIAGDAEDDAFLGEWVAIHEFLHLGMPFVRTHDAWLSEGFVTYYTSVLRTRAGFRGEQEAWDAILDGFRRGRTQATDLTVGEASVQMHDRYAFLRVYWGGAAIALLADVAVRTASKGARSLDGAMRHLHDCCASSPRRWSADETLRELDAWVGATTLQDLARRELERPGFVDLTPALSALGVQDTEAGAVLSGDPAATDLRQALLGTGRTGAKAP
ncbi:MAG: hypothetical protein R3A51_13135 [Nannocystaceae bacterium]